MLSCIWGVSVFIFRRNEFGHAGAENDGVLAFFQIKYKKNPVA
jgi:hypothetical protein